MRPSFFHHLHPPTIPAVQARLRYTWGAGGLSVFFLLVVGLTGALELFYYIPTPEQAALSVQEITYLVPFGGLVRNLHFWSAQLLVITSLLHLIRVIFTGAYAPPRRVNYWIGMGLLISVLILDFTGYALRWDEGVRWALVTGTNLIQTIPGIGGWLYRLVVGGDALGPAALIRFFAWHIFGLVLLIVFLTGWHIFRVRRDGGIAVPPPEKRPNPARISRFELARREGVAALLASALLIALAAFFPAPIAAPIAPDLGGEAAVLSGDPRAPWFFLWIQELLKLGDPFIFGILIPAGIFIFLILIPVLFKPPPPEEWGRWFPSTGRPVQAATGLILALILFLSLRALIQPT